MKTTSYNHDSQTGLALSITLFLLGIPFVFEFIIIFFFNSYIFISNIFILFYFICILIWIFQSYLNYLNYFPLLEFNINEEKLLEQEYYLDIYSKIKMKVIITNNGLYINDLHSLNKKNKFIFYGWDKLESISTSYEFKRGIIGSKYLFVLKFEKKYSSFFWDSIDIYSFNEKEAIFIDKLQLLIKDKFLTESVLI